MYDGDGTRVASTINGITTKFIGEYYEVTGTEVTKYYGGKTAMRTTSGLTYLLSDHIGSNSLIVDSSGSLLSETRYKAWGEIRYSTGTTTTPYTYTGQYSNTSDFGWMYYKARWYDPALGRFNQADTIVPSAGDPRAWDRYSYVKNNPVVYNDPSGHILDIPSFCPDGCSIINMSSWSNSVKIALTFVMALTVDNVTGGRTGVYGDNWGFIPDAEYWNSGAWTMPPILGGVVSSGDDLVKLGMKGAKELLEESGEAIVEKTLKNGLSENADEVVKKIHGNSLNSPNNTVVYDLLDENGTHLKYGITSEEIPANRYTNSFMEGKSMKILNSGSRREMFRFENDLIIKNPRGALQLNYH